MHDMLRLCKLTYDHISLQPFLFTRIELEVIAVQVTYDIKPVKTTPWTGLLLRFTASTSVPLTASFELIPIMATSLQQQLAAIHAKSTNELDLKAQREQHSNSLLFESSVARSQSMDVIYQICFEGFEKLCALDARFVRYERSIFAPHSKSQDRQLMTEQENKELDGVLEAFLGLVGARILLTPGQKAVEWLIRRFRVHEHNIEALVLTFLPYHSLSIFPTLLSILPTQLSPTLKFLHTYINTGAKPPRSVLVYAATHNTAFFAALNRYVLSCAKARTTYPVLLEFWASIMAQAVNDIFDTSASGRRAVRTQREEDTLIRILPVLNEGLALKHTPDLLLGCYMIIAVLVSKANLDDHALDKMLAAVLQGSTVNTIEAALSCAAVIVDRREAPTLPRGILKRLLKIESIGDHLQAIGDKQPIQRFLIVLFQSITARIGKELLSQSPTLLQTVLSSGRLTQTQKDVLKEQLAHALLKAQSADPDGNVRKQIRDITSMLEDVKAGEPQAAIEDEMDVDDVQDAAELMQTSPSDELVLPEVALNPLPTSSFLTVEASETFSILLKAFEQFAVAKKVDAFMHAPAMDKATPTSIATFLARVWTSSRFVVAKYAALVALVGRVEAMGADVDYQALLPYVLVALADPAPKVRRDAAELLRRLSNYASSNASHFEESDFYGSSTKNMKWLSAKDVSSLYSKVLLPSLEECVSDPDHISSVIATALSSSSSAGASNNSSERLRTSQRSEVFLFLTSHIQNTISLPMRLMLLSTLNRIGKDGGHSRSKYLLPIWREWAETNEEVVQQMCTSQGVERVRLDQETLLVAQSDDAEALSYLMSICLGKVRVRNYYQVLAFDRLVALWPQLRAKTQMTTAETLVNTALQSNQGSIAQEQALRALNSIRIQSDALTLLVEKAVDQLNHRDQPSASKRRRTEKTEIATSGTATEYQKDAVTRIELIMKLADERRAGADLILFYVLFSVLQALQDFRSHSATDMGYVRNLALHSLWDIMDEMSAKASSVKVDPQRIRTDLLVDCVRNTTDIQARRDALQLLSGLSRSIPQAVLHSIMPVFTLMSSTTLREGDEFSAHVVDQTIQQVIPLLVQSLRDQKKDLVAATAEIILSFAAAFEHIAAHRRLQLYRLLVASLGPSESLFAVIATLIDHFTQSNELNGQQDDVEEFVVDLFRQFSSTECLTSIVKLINLCLDSLQPKPILSKILLSQVQGSPVKNTSRLLAVLPLLLDSSSFRSKIRVDLSDEEKASELRTTFALALETVLKLSQAAKKHPELHDSCSVGLEKLLGLFPLNELATSIEPLLSHSDDNIRRSVFKTLELRVRTSKNVDRKSTEAITALLPHLTHVLQDTSATQLRPNALAAIDQICERFGKSDTAATLEVAQVIAGPTCIGSDSEIVQVLSLHCLASIVGILQSEFIPLLQQVLASSVSCLMTSISKTSKSLHTASYAFFTALADNVPFMISKTALQQIVDLSHESAVAQLSTEDDESRVQFLQLVATRVDMVTVLSVAEVSWDHAVKQGPKVCHSISKKCVPHTNKVHQAVHDHLDMFNILIDNHSKGNISRNAQSVFRVLLTVFDLRHACTLEQNTSKYDREQVEAIEQKVIALAIACIYKINDTIFRPFFTQLLDWSSTALPKRETAHRTLRSITFFNFIGTLSETLKSIFTSYFNYVIDRSKEILESTNAKDTSVVQLKTAVLRALSSSFKHDQDEFWQSPNHFDAIMQPLIAQLGTLPAVQANEELVPAITELAIANEKSVDHHKAMNGQLLQLLRHDSARARMAAVKCQESLAKALKDEWLGHLPEMLPFISELQDDDNEGVARETNRWIKLIEEILGESLDSMLQ